ncbi:LuxR family transcriptional regulator [bacterium]|nr:MAG: LuxR family transcriptional regulator [bacterium]
MVDGTNVSGQLDPNDLDRLSDRERQVLSLASAGLVDKQIAAELDITLNTLRTYWSRIRAKIGEVPRSALSALFAERRAARADRGLLGASWHIDLERRVFCYYGDRDIPTGEIGLEAMFDQFHPEDEPRVRLLLVTIEEHVLPPFMFMARYRTEHGTELASAYVEVERDEAGRAVRIVGRAAPIINLASSGPAASVGTYERDLGTNRIEVDDGFCAIFRVDPNAPDLLEQIINRNCPEYRAVFRTTVGDMIAEGRSKLTHAFRLCFDDGTRLWVSSHLTLEYEAERPVRVRSTIMAYE